MVGRAEMPTSSSLSSAKEWVFSWAEHLRFICHSLCDHRFAGPGGAFEKAFRLKGATISALHNIERALQKWGSDRVYKNGDLMAEGGAVSPTMLGGRWMGPTEQEKRFRLSP